MAMFTQAFRYAYEPFVFGKSRNRDDRGTYSAAMKYFFIFSMLAFLAVMFYMDYASLYGSFRLLGRTERSSHRDGGRDI